MLASQTAILGEKVVCLFFKLKCFDFSKKCVFYFILLNLNSLVVFIDGGKGGQRMPGGLGATSSNSFPKVSL